MATQYDKTLASDMNSLFSRLQKIRTNHLSGAGQSSSAITSLTPAFNETPAEQGKKAQEQYTLMKQYINVLRKSVFLTTITDSEVNAIVVPEAGSLLKLTEYGVADTLITKIEGMAFTNSTNFATFFANNNSNFFNTNRTNFSNNSGFFNTNRTNFSNNSGFFNSNNSGHFTSNRSNFSSHFTSNRSNFSGHFSSNRSNFSSHFSSNRTFFANHGFFLQGSHF